MRHPSLRLLAFCGILSLLAACGDDATPFFPIGDAIGIDGAGGGDSGTTDADSDADSDAGDPDADDPDAEDPDAADPDAESDAVDPDVSGDAADPDAVDPDADGGEPDAVDPDAVDPDVVDPDAVDPDVPDPDGGDVCDGRDVCPAPGLSCDGTDLVTCARDADGCLVAFRTDCAAAENGICDETGPVPQCGIGDACAVLPNACATEGRACDENDLVVCAENSDGCLVETRTTCTEVENGFCDPTADPVACGILADVCADVPDRCEVVETRCDADDVVTCAPDAFGCLVESRTDCTERDGTCVEESGTAICQVRVDPCEGVEQCASEGAACAGDTLVECAPDEFGCRIETRTACDDVERGFCDADALSCGVAPDPCEGVEQCEAVGVGCEGRVRVACAPDMFGCLTETRTNCEDSGDICVDATCVDPCSLVDECPETAYCDGNAAVTCVLDGSGCLIEASRIACVPPTSCEDNGPTAGCDDPCVGRAVCEPAGFSNFCDGNDRVTCEIDGDGCFVEVRSSCTAIGRTCAGGVCENPCGNGIREIAFGETCDDGDRASGDGCSSTCGLEAGFRCDTSSNPTVCEAIDCGDGVIDAGEECDDDNGRNRDGCSSTCRVDDGFTCIGEPSVCTADPVCGDGEIDVATEFCDDGDTSSGDGCSSTCRVESGFTCLGEPSLCTRDPECGDGEITAGEFCDDGDTSGGDGCSAVCEVEPGYRCLGEPSVCSVLAGCGDGVLTSGEECDDGDLSGGDGCSALCRVEPGFVCTAAGCTDVTDRCGNGVVDEDRFEGCDDGGRDDGDGCSSTCAVELPASRDELVSLAVQTNLTSATYQRATASGNGCGPHSTSGAFAYRAVRVVNPAAATLTLQAWTRSDDDGYLFVYAPVFDPEEELAGCLRADDDYSTPNASGTTGGSLIEDLEVGPNEERIVVFTEFASGDDVINATLNFEQSGCGDQFERDTEECDDGNASSGDGCSAACTLEDGFECDSDEPTVCREIACGDGLIDEEEECDDGDASSGDGCSRTCQIEPDTVCVGQPSLCRAVECGDGIIDAAFGEECDDRDASSGDGCSSTCQVEPDTVCVGQPSLCRPVECGDGLIDAAFGEQCDDDNAADDDGCSSACELEEGFFCLDGEPTLCRPLECGDGVIDIEAGERCDDTNGEPFDGCGATCLIESSYRCEGTPSRCERASCGDGFLAIGEGCGEGGDVAAERCTDCVIDWPEPGDSLSFSGSIDASDSLYRRATTFCSSLEFDDTFRFDSYTFENRGTETVEVEIEIEFVGGGDTVAYFYDGPFLNTSATTNCEVGDADFPFSGASRPTIGAVSLSPGQQGTLVVTTWEPLDTPGAYSVSVTGAECGDGVIHTTSGEVCDDGNEEDGDGCSSLCQTESGYDCVGEPSRCDGDVCGDGFLEVDEQCDDDNLLPGDGCSPSCLVEEDWACDDGEPSLCEFFDCGDGVVANRLGSEACDDGDALGGDGCSSTCEVEPGFNCVGAPSVCTDLSTLCGNGVIDAETFEACDDGDTADGDGCSSTCALEVPTELGEGVEWGVEVPSGADTFVRRGAGALFSCGGTSGFGEFYYQGYRIVNPSAEAVDLMIGASWPLQDGYLNVFGGAFDPSDSSIDCLAADDDYAIFGGVSSLRGSLIEGFTLEAGAEAIVVATSYSALVALSSSRIFVDVQGCGDGYDRSDEGELCDDGNVASGDGCSALCRIESGFTCDGEPSLCAD